MNVLKEEVGVKVLKTINFKKTQRFYMYMTNICEGSNTDAPLMMQHSYLHLQIIKLFLSYQLFTQYNMAFVAWCYFMNFISFKLFEKLTVAIHVADCNKGDPGHTRLLQCISVGS